MLIDRLGPVDVTTVARQTESGDAGTRSLVTELVSAGRVVALGGDGSGKGGALLLTTPAFDRLGGQAQETMTAFFREHPLRSGMPKEELKSRLGLPARAFTEVLGHWLRDGSVIEAGALVAPSGRTVTLTPAQEREAQEYVRQLHDNPYAPTPARAPDAELLSHLAETGQVESVGDGIVFAADAYERMVARIVEHLKQERTITLAQVRDMFGASRKYAQSLLEYLDQRGVTRRLGDERVLR
jgi:selenocysteine-specific elongation factor